MGAGVPTPSTTTRTNALINTTAPAAIRTAPTTRSGVTAQNGRGCRTRQPVSHQGTSPATTPGASAKKTTLPTAAAVLRIRPSSATPQGPTAVPLHQPPPLIALTAERRATLNVDPGLHRWSSRPPDPTVLPRSLQPDASGPARERYVGHGVGARLPVGGSARKGLVIIPASAAISARGGKHSQVGHRENTAHGQVGRRR